MRNMILVLCFLGLLAGLARGQDEGFSYDEFTFYFHDGHNLLLTMDADNCYFTEVKDDEKEVSLHDHKEDVEKFVLGSIYRHRHGQEGPQPSSLDKMRSKYGDLLADYHCRDKDIFTLQIDLSELNRDGNVHHWIPGLEEHGDGHKWWSSLWHLFESKVGHQHHHD